LPRAALEALEITRAVVIAVAISLPGRTGVLRCAGAVSLVIGVRAVVPGTWRVVASKQYFRRRVEAVVLTTCNVLIPGVERGAGRCDLVGAALEACETARAVVVVVTVSLPCRARVLRGARFVALMEPNNLLVHLEMPNGLPTERRRGEAAGEVGAVGAGGEVEALVGWRRRNRCAAHADQ